MKHASAAICFLLLFSFSAAAQQPLADTLHIKGVEVKSEKVKKKEISPYPQQSLTVSEIDAVAGNSVAEAVKTFPGVVMRDYGGAGGLKTVMIRSFGAGHTGVFVDGSPITDISSGQTDLGKFPLTRLEEVNLSLGANLDEPISARARNSAGTINLKSITPDFSKYSTRGSFSIKGGSFGLINPSLGLDRKISKTLIAAADVNGLISNGEYPYTVDNGPAGTENLKRSNSDIKSLNFRFFVDYQPSDSSNLKTTFRYYNSERGLPGAVVYYNPYSSQRLDNKDFSINSSYSAARKKYSMLSSTGFSRGWLRYTDPDYLGFTESLDNTYLQHEFFLSYSGVLRHKHGFLSSFATDYIFNNFSSNQYNNSNPVRNTLIFSAGVIHKHKITETSAGLLINSVNDKNTLSESAKNTLKAMPYATIYIRIAEKPAVRLRMMYKNTFRMPSFNELYYQLVGNARLLPENANQLNLGVLANLSFYNKSHIRLTADVFKNRISNKIIAVPTQNLFVWSMQNIGKVSTTGAEILIEGLFKAGEKTNISASLGYTWQEALDVSDKTSETYEHQIPYVPYETFSGRIQLGYQNLSLDYNILFNGFRYSAATNIHQNLLPSWWISDAGLSWNLPAKRFSYKLKAEITNLLDKEYVVIRSFPMPGRSFGFSAALNF